MEKKKGFKRNQFAGLLAAVFCIVIFNSILIIKEEKGKDYSFAYNNLSNPFSLYASGDASTDHSITPGQNNKGSFWVASAKTPLANSQPATEIENTAPEILPNEVLEPALENALMHVAADDVELSLTAEEKQKVKSTIDATKKVISTMQWKEINNDIADAMTEKEKVQARQEYMVELDKTMNWKNMEQNMKASYEQLDWNKINHNISNALASIKLDSLENNYEAIIVQLNKANTEACSNSKVTLTPLPDQSVEQIRKSTDELRRKVETLKALRSPKKVVRL